MLTVQISLPLVFSAQHITKHTCIFIYWYLVSVWQRMNLKTLLMTGCASLNCRRGTKLVCLIWRAATRWSPGYDMLQCIYWWGTLKKPLQLVIFMSHGFNWKKIWDSTHDCQKSLMYNLNHFLFLTIGMIWDMIFCSPLLDILLLQ